MGVLIDGVWTDGELPQETGETGQFKRADSRYRGCGRHPWGNRARQAQQGD